MANPAAKMAIDWVLGDPNLSPTAIAKALGLFGHHTIEMEVENLTDDEWDIEYYISHGTNAFNPVKSLAPMPDATDAQGTILGIEGTGVGAAGVIVLTRKRDSWSCAAWASNLAGGTCQFQLLLGYRLQADLLTVYRMDDLLPLHKSLDGHLERYGSGVHVSAHMTGTDTSTFILQISDAPLAYGAITSVENGLPMVAEDGLKNDSLIYCKKGTPIKFMFQGNADACNFRIPGKNLYLNYRNLTGAVKLYDDSSRLDGLFSIKQACHGFSLYSIDYSQYMCLDGNEPYIKGSGDPQKKSAQWRLSLPF